MKKLLFCILLLPLLSACGSGTFSVPKEDYQSRVQVLGVLPVLVDNRVDLKYPEQSLLFDVLTRSVTDQHDWLVTQLKEKKGYFDVRKLNISSNLVGQSLLSGGTDHDEYGRPLGYRFDTATVVELTRQNVVDAVLVVVLSGEHIKEKRRSRTKLETLETWYSDIIASAAVIDRQGQVLWQLAGDDAEHFLTLQYADFDEAYYNRTDVVKVKNITLSGIEKVLSEGADSEKDEPAKVYRNVLDEIASSISPGLLDSLR